MNLREKYKELTDINEEVISKQIDYFDHIENLFYSKLGYQSNPTNKEGSIREYKIFKNKFKEVYNINIDYINYILIINYLRNLEYSLKIQLNELILKLG